MQKLSRINAACFQEALSCGVDAGSIRSIEPTTPFVLFCIDVFHQSILHMASKGSLERCQEEWYSLPLDTRKVGPIDSFHGLGICSSPFRCPSGVSPRNCVLLL